VSGLALYHAPGDAAGLRAQITEALRHPFQLAEMAQRARASLGGLTFEQQVAELIRFLTGG
jgi:hypothetical protein